MCTLSSTWGSNKLCTRHYVQWATKKSLELPKDEPQTPPQEWDNKDKQSLIKVILKGQDFIGALPYMI